MISHNPLAQPVPLAEVRSAHALIKSSAHIGRIVLTVGRPPEPAPNRLLRH